MILIINIRVTLFLHIHISHVHTFFTFIMWAEIEILEYYTFMCESIIIREYYTFMCIATYIGIYGSNCKLCEYVRVDLYYLITETKNKILRCVVGEKVIEHVWLILKM